MENKNNFEQEIAAKEFMSYADNLNLLVEYDEKFDDKFLKVKLAFVALTGVIFTTIFSRIEEFTKTFLIIFIIIVFLIFLLLMYELWQKTKELYKAIERQYKKVSLAKIRHISTMGKYEFSHYGEETENLLLEMDHLYQAMHEGKSIKEMVKIKEKHPFWKIRLNFILWAILLLSVPTLFLFEILCK